MKLSFSGLDTPIEILPGEITTLEIANQELFGRICSSLKEGKGREALEPYTCWEAEMEISPKNALLFIDSPLVLPWDSKPIMGAVIKRLTMSMLENEELRSRIDRSASDVMTAFLSLGMTMHTEYSFNIQWDIQKFIHTFGFGVEHTDDQSIFENCIDFISLALDANVKQCIVFVNLKSFLTKSAMQKFANHVFFSKIPVLLLEQSEDLESYIHEQKRAIDLDFIEY